MLKNFEKYFATGLRQPPKARSTDLLDGRTRSWLWLSEYGPSYAVRGSQVVVIETPAEFYKILLERSRTATKRVTFASLYLGTGILEEKLISALKDNMTKRPGLEVKVLLDYARGSRGKHNSRTMLSTLIQTSHSSKIFLYHTPSLRGVRKKLLPQKWDELLGLQHMKIYIFDDSLIITGANLSNDYFTNRQDRYFLIENSSDLADFYDGLISKVSTFSFQMDGQNRVELHSNWTLDPSNGDGKEFIQAARKTILDYYDSCRSMRKGTGEEEEIDEASLEINTWLFPLIQMGSFRINYDDSATSRLFSAMASGSIVKLATGYFNLTPNYSRRIIAESLATFDILMAHPQANGFMGARFPAGGIPAAYTLLAKKFFEELKASGQGHRIKMFEYLKSSWTFHAKGLWFYPPGENTPLVTLIGSPNFGYRSVYRDLETQLYLVTKDPNLRLSLHNEQHRLYSHSQPLEDKIFLANDHLVPLWVHIVIRFFKNYF